MGSNFAGAAAAPAVDTAAAPTIDSGIRVLGPTSRGAAALLAACRGGASTVDVGGAPTVPAVPGVTGGLRGRGLEALAGEGGVGRERIYVAPPGSEFLGKEVNMGSARVRVRYSRHELYELAYRSRVEIQLSHSERVRRSDFDWGCGHGSSDGERVDAKLESVVEACLAAQDCVTRSVLSTDSADRDVVASAGSFRLRACAGSV